MNRDDLKLVQKLMASDLSDSVDWSKAEEENHVFGTSPTPYHHRALDINYWTAISKKKCFIEDPFTVDKTNALAISMDSRTLQ